MSFVDTILDRAVEAAHAGEEALQNALEQLPAPVYVADDEGRITYFNAACIDFTGRRPKVGQDRWCVTWRLHTEAGDFLPHNQCPMAVAIQTRRPVRGVIAVAERPDGTKVTFRPYPTPIFDKRGRFIGAVNLLEDVTDELRAGELHAQAERCRRLAKGIDDVQVADTLNRMAEEYDSKAARIRDQLARFSPRADQFG
jgi:PAS domain S-box-containing protein